MSYSTSLACVTAASFQLTILIIRHYEEDQFNNDLWAPGTCFLNCALCSCSQEHNIFLYCQTSVLSVFIFTYQLYYLQLSPLHAGYTPAQNILAKSHQQTRNRSNNELNYTHEYQLLLLTIHKSSYLRTGSYEVVLTWA